MPKKGVLQSSRWSPVLWPNTSKTIRTSTFFSFNLDMHFVYIYKINSRIWFGPVNSNFHFEDCFCVCIYMYIEHLFSIYFDEWSWSYGSWIYNFLCNQSLSPLMLWVQISTRTRCTTLCDKVCQWLVAGWLFSPGTPVSSTNKSIKTDRHDITEILLKVALNTINKPKGGRRVKGVKVWNQLKICLLYIKGFDCKIDIMAKTLGPF